jgi:peptide/nickel transport system permease protein
MSAHASGAPSPTPDLTRATAESAAVPVAIRASDGGPARTALRRFLRHRGALFGLLTLAALGLAVALAPVLVPYDPTRPSVLEAFRPPSLSHPMGTDQFGRDVLARVLYGGRISLTVGFVAVVLGTLVGTLLGLNAGYFRGRIDELIMRGLDVMLAFPGVLLAMAIVALLGPSLPNLMIAVGVGLVPSFARLVRGSVLSAQENLYVLSARGLGAPDHIVMLRHILPNVLAPVIVYMTLSLATSILAGASLNFLGLGVKPPTPEWGLILSDGRDQIRRAWWVATFPGLAIMLATLAINFVGDGLRDALDPRLRID